MADRIRSQKIGISSYTENELVLDVIGKTNIVGDVNISGVSTLGTVQVSSGIISATTGVVTYYGDGSHLFGVTAFNVVQQDIVNQVVYPTLANSTGVSSVGISTTQLVFNPSTGNLGIGTTNPTTKLQIGGVLGFGPGNNVRIGDNTTGANLTYGTDNIFMGVGAGKSTTTGFYNNFFGSYAGKYNDGYNNNFLGYSAGKSHYGVINGLSITTSTTIPAQENQNYYVTPSGGSGTGALLGFYRDGNGDIVVTGYNNPGYNYQVGDVLTVDGSLVGGTSGVDDVTVTITEVVNSYGSNNNFFGSFAGYNNTTGNDNNFFGRYSGCYNTTGSSNNFFGRYSGYCNTTGYYNNFFGSYSGYCNTTGYYNNFFGNSSGRCNTTGYYNNFFGSYSGLCNTTGSNNIFFGSQAGNYNTTGSNNIFFGSHNGLSNTASNKVILGSGYDYSNRFDSPNTSKDNQLAIGLRTDTNESKYWLVGDENFNVGIGTTNPKVRLQIDGVLGFGTFYNSGTRTNIRIGDETTGANLTSGYDNIFMGVGAGKSTTTGYYNNFFGFFAGSYNTTGSHNNFFGAGSGYNNTTGGANNFFGVGSGYCNTTGGANNFLGYCAGYYNTTGYYNNFFGARSGYYNTTGYYNNFFGLYSGFCNTTGSNNIFFGNYNGLSNIASRKVIIGSGYNYSTLFDSPDTTKDTQLAIGLRTDANPSKYWLVGDENFNIGIGTTNPTSKLTVGGDARVTGILTVGSSSVTIDGVNNQITVGSGVTIQGTGDATYAGIITAAQFVGAVTGTATSATKLETPRTFEITGAITASPVSFDGTANVALASTIAPNATLPGNVTIGNDLQVNNNLNVTGNITIGGTSAYIIANDFRVKDADIVLGFTTDSYGNEVSNDTTANHGGVAVASTEGSPLISLYNVAIGETNPATYKKIMWFKSGAFTGLNTDTWISNYPISIGTTSAQNGSRLTVGTGFTVFDTYLDATDIRARNISASGIVTGYSFRPSSGYYQSANGTNSFYVYDGTGNVAFQGTIGASQINNASGYKALDFGTSTTPSVNITNGLNVGTGGTIITTTGIGSVGIGSTQPGSTLVVNAPSGYTGNLLDLQVGGTSHFSYNVTTGLTQLAKTNPSGQDFRLFAGWSAVYAGRIFAQLNGNNGPALLLGFSSLGLEGTGFAFNMDSGGNVVSSAVLIHDASFTLAQRNGTNAQTFRVYNTYTTSTNFERANVGWTTNTFIVGTEKGSAGGSPRQLELQTDGTTRVAITTDGYVGIGSTQPTQTLDVNGNVKATRYYGEPEISPVMISMIF